MRLRLPRTGARTIVVSLLLLPLLAGTLSCSLKRTAARSVANALTSGPDVFATDDDPELIREAVPFGLKTMESLLQIVPTHQGLLLGLCRGYTQYAFGFVQLDAEKLELSGDYGATGPMRERALRLYLRARTYGLRGLELRHRGIAQGLVLDPAHAAAALDRRDVPLVFWTAAAWGSAIALGKDHAELLADLGVVRALMERGLALDETWDGGAFHEAMIVLEALPTAMGGSPERAREHFRRAVELSHGTRPGPFVTLAQSVSVMTQDQKEFRTLLEQALAIDANRDTTQRLQTIIFQERARTLLSRQSDLFIESDTTAQEGHR